MKKAVFIAVAALSMGASWAAGAGAAKARPKRADPPIVADLRTVAAAEAAYAKLNGGYYDEPPCLEKPASCLKSYPEGKPGLLAHELARMDMKDGFNRSFHSGDRVDPSIVQGGTVSRSSLEGFAYVAVPKVKGEPAYCVDHHRMCIAKDGIMPRPQGSCPASCKTIE